MKRLSCIITFFAAFAQQCALSTEEIVAEHALTGLRPVAVRVLGIKKDDAFRNELRTSVELELRKTQVAVTADDIKAKIVIYPVVQTLPIKRADGKLEGYVYSVRIKANTRTIIEENAMQKFSTIWQSTSTLGTTTPGSLYKDIRESIKTASDQFLNDYLEANPLDKRAESGPRD